MIMQADPVRFLLQNIKITSRGGEILSLLQKIKYIFALTVFPVSHKSIAYIHSELLRIT